MMRKIEPEYTQLVIGDTIQYEGQSITLKSIRNHGEGFISASFTDPQGNVKTFDKLDVEKMVGVATKIDALDV
jgi:hypothetical protein|tara:strand:- start:582 stop:800 length:219 start_codon:yes stop_codon:yes gene_type:complete